MRTDGGRFTVTRLREVSRDDLLARRRALLDRLDVALEELRGRAADGLLVGDEWMAWDELQEIDFLLGDDEHNR